MSKWLPSLSFLAGQIGPMTIALVAGCLLALAPTRANAVSSTFDSNLEGWSAWGFEVDVIFFPPAVTGLTLVSNLGDMEHNTPLGNPDGYARLTDAIEEPASFARAPAIYLGDLTAFFGGTFSFDHKLFFEGLDVLSIAPYSLIIISGNPLDLNALVWTSLAPDGPMTPWVHFEITLDMTDLMLIQDADVRLIYPASPISGTVGEILNRSATMTPAEIMADVSDILVGFEIVNNQGLQRSEHGGIDNVNMVAATPTDPMCGDVEDDLDIDSDDSSTFRRFLADPEGSPLSAAGAEKCKVILDPSSEPRPCDMLDVVVLRRAILMLPPGIAPVCESAVAPQST